MDNPSCIDLIITNRKRYFQHTKVIETGISDHHKMTITMFKSKFKKAKPNIITYRDYKNFDRDLFRKQLSERFSVHDEIQYKCFDEIYINILDRHAPIKTKYVRANDGPFMNKTLKKAIMKRTNLRKKYLKSTTEKSKNAYRKQRNFCVKLFKKEKKKYYNNLDVKQITDNKKFWTSVKPLFTDKGLKSKNIVLIENEQIISDDKGIAERMYNVFINTIKNLNIEEVEDNLTPFDNIEDPIFKIIKKYESHPSILKIKTKIKIIDKFYFEKVTEVDIEKEILQLDNTKSTPSNSIPTKLFKENIDLYSDIITKMYNKSVHTSTFPDKLKSAEVITVHKKNETTDKTNYRPVSLLPTLSKIYERIMYKQMSEYINKYLSDYLCGFRKGIISSQHSLIIMI